VSNIGIRDLDVPTKLGFLFFKLTLILYTVEIHKSSDLITVNYFLSYFQNPLPTNTCIYIISFLYASLNHVCQLNVVDAVLKLLLNWFFYPVFTTCPLAMLCKKNLYRIYAGRIL